MIYECLARKTTKINTKELQTNTFSMIEPMSILKIVSSPVLQERLNSAGLGGQTCIFPRNAHFQDWALAGYWELGSWNVLSNKNVFSCLRP